MKFVGGIADGRNITIEEGCANINIDHPQTTPFIAPADCLEEVKAISSTRYTRYERIRLHGDKRCFEIMTCLGPDDTIEALIVGYRGFRK